MAKTPADKIQELRVLHMSITALRKKINTEVDELQAIVETLLPRQKSRYLSKKEMNEYVESVMSS